MVVDFYFGHYELLLQMYMQCMDPSTSKKLSARVNGYCSMNSEEQLHCIGLIMLL